MRGIDVEAVSAWFERAIPGASPPLTFELVSGGHSNLTYAVYDAAGHRYVLRRPPLGELPRGAHDMKREYRVLSALGDTVVPVPRVLDLCVDASIADRPFYVMERLDGHVMANVDEVGVLGGIGARQHASAELVMVLSELHLLDIDEIGLSDLARRDDFISRQLARLFEVWSRTKTRDLPLMDDLCDRLAELQPPQRYTGIVHSDFRFGNVMVSPRGDIVGVLDWELCTLGDVLADVGYLLNNWDTSDDAPRVWMEVPPTVAEGFWSRAEVVASYIARTGFDLADIDYYRAFAYWRLAVIAEGVKKRYESAAMANDSVDFGHLERRVEDLAVLADTRLRSLKK